MTDATLETTLAGIGDGLGSFLSAIYLPLGNLLLVLGIIGGVVSIFMGIAYAVKKSIQK